MARKRGRSHSKRRIIVGATLAISAASLIAATTLTTGTSHSTTAAALITAPAEASSSTPTPLIEPDCAADQTYIAPEHVGVEGMQSCLPTGSGLTESHVDPLYGQVALELLRTTAPLDERLETRTPNVVCWNLQDWKQILERFRARGTEFGSSLLGWVTPTKDVINLSTHTCKRLDKIAHANETPGSEIAASAVGTFAHETIHLGGIANEGIADCYGKQLTRIATELLGANSDTARLTAKLSAEYIHQQRAGTDYDDPNCHHGGALDLNLDDTSWS